MTLASPILAGSAVLVVVVVKTPLAAVFVVLIDVIAGGLGAPAVADALRGVGAEWWQGLVGGFGLDGT